MSPLGRGAATGLGQTSLHFGPQSPAMWTGTPLRALAIGNLRGAGGGAGNAAGAFREEHGGFQARQALTPQGSRQGREGDGSMGSAGEFLIYLKKKK